MYHTVQFTADLDRSPGDGLDRVVLSSGDRRRARLRPHVIEAADGPMEVADLLFEDGTSVRSVPFACFRFIDRAEGPARNNPPARSPLWRGAKTGALVGAVFVALAGGLLLGSAEPLASLAGTSGLVLPLALTVALLGAVLGALLGAAGGKGR
jgi:hypothetical protein